MATVYSLVCWGGRTGKTVTLTVESPCVVTSTNHGLRDGTRLVFSTTGALPTGITAGTTYYTRYVAANTFHLYDTEAHAKDTASTTGRINTSGTQSGTHTAKSALMLDYFSQYPGRWGDADAERCYDGLVSWNSARAGASPLDVEVCELGQAYDDAMTSATGFTVSVPAAKIIITSTIDDVRTEAFHNGVIRAGYNFWRTTANTSSGTLMLPVRGEVDGFTIYHTNPWYQPNGVQNAVLSITRNMILLGSGTTRSGYGVTHAACATTINCLAMGWSVGFCSTYGQLGITIANCIAAKNINGITSAGTSGTYGYYYNNISVGNTTNWVTNTDFTDASNNFGATGDTPWTTGSNPTYTLATTDFANFGSSSAWATTDDLSPALVTSPQVDAGISFYGYGETDLRDAEVPNYNNGGAEAIDAGCYEFDHGYGNHPATATISLSNIVSGSRVLITRDDTSAVLYNDVPGASLSLSTGYIGNFSVVIRKASESPFYREFSAGGTTVANQTTSIKALQQLDE